MDHLSFKQITLKWPQQIEEVGHQIKKEQAFWK